MIKFRNSFNLKKTSLENPSACCKFDSCGSHLTVAGHATNVFFWGHLNNVLIKQNSSKIKKSLNCLIYVVSDTIPHHTITNIINIVIMYIKIVFTKHPYVWECPYGWPGIVLRKLGQIIIKYVVKKLNKIKPNLLNLNVLLKSWLELV